MSTKNIILLVIGVAAAVALFLFGRSCGIKSVIKTTHIDTIIRKDSVRVKYQPVPYNVTHDSLIYVKGKPVIISVHDTTDLVRIEPADTVAILKRYYQKLFYDTTITFKRGSVRLIDTVTRNRITGRQVNVMVTDTTIHEVVTLRPPKRIILYFGIDYLGYQKTPFYALGADLTLKLPNDQLFTIGALVDKDGKLIYQAGYKRPIRLKRR